MPEYIEFPQENIDKALALARSPFEGVDLQSADMLTPEAVAQAGPAAVSAGCVALRSEGKKVCLKVPFAGNICVPVDLPDGTFAEACVDICTRFGVPTGACVVVRAAGKQVWRQCFGWC
ncbi:hypothetical protein [Streptomyces sclerotialus]|uniref:hypothetical protein n=1 Tax=Streptomyces sclerotialus TaxID=1957 RepID=UPI0004C7D52A